MIQKTILALFLALMHTAVNAGVIGDLTDGLGKLAKLNHEIEWFFVSAVVTLLTAMFVSFGKVAGKLNSDIMKVAVGLGYLLGEIVCVILLVVQFQEVIIMFFDYIAGLF